LKAENSVLLLISTVGPYRVPLLRLLSDRFSNFKLIYDAYIEPGRHWNLDLSEFDARKSFGTIAIRRNATVDAGQMIYLHLLLVLQIFLVRPSVIITTELGTRTIWACLYKLVFPKTKLVFWLTLSERTEGKRGKFRRAVRKALFRRSDSFIVSSVSAENYVLDLYPESRPKIFRAPQSAAFEGCRADELTEASGGGSSDRPYSLLFVGNSSPRKNLEVLISWLNEWAVKSESFAELNIAGVDNSIENYKNTQNLELRFHGYLGFEELKELYKTSQAFLMPSLEDEWGLVVNEALSMGCPVIGSTHAEAVVELVSTGKNGWQFNPLSQESFEQAMNSFKATQALAGKSMEIRRNASSSARKTTPEIFFKAFELAILLEPRT